MSSCSLEEVSSSWCRREEGTQRGGLSEFMRQELGVLGGQDSESLQSKMLKGKEPGRGRKRKGERERDVEREERESKRVHIQKFCGHSFSDTALNLS